MQKYLIILTGPTGVGKTSTGIKLANYFNTEIISCDSRQIYKELNIGTAVPNKEELLEIKHHLIQCHSIHENFNVSKFEKEAISTISLLFKRHNVVLFVGGSMLYIDSVCNGIDAMPDADPEIRDMLKQKLNTGGIESLRFQLKKIDPDYYNTVDLKNTNRIVHALEVSILTGKPYSTFLTKSKKYRPFSVIKIGLNCERTILHNRINIRVDNMINAGLEDEASNLYHLKHLNALNTVGYRELFAYFNDEISREKAIELIKRNSRRYARKQLTWFRKDAEMSWFQPNQTKEIITFIENKITGK